MALAHGTVLQLVTALTPVGLSNIGMEVGSNIVSDSRKRLAAAITASGDKPVDHAALAVEMGPTSHQILRMLAERHPAQPMPTLYWRVQFGASSIGSRRWRDDRRCGWRNG